MLSNHILIWINCPYKIEWKVPHFSSLDPENPNHDFIFGVIANELVRKSKRDDLDFSQIKEAIRKYSENLTQSRQALYNPNSYKRFYVRGKNSPYFLSGELKKVSPLDPEPIYMLLVSSTTKEPLEMLKDVLNSEIVAPEHSEV